MARDYAKVPEKQNKRRRKAKRAVKPKHKRGYLLLFFLLLVGMSLGANYIYHHIDFKGLQNAFVKKLPLSPSKQAKKPLVKTRFEFYTRLPKGESRVLLRRESKGKTKVVEQQPVPEAVDGGHYILQVGSFRRFPDADKLKAELLLKGYDVNVSKINIADIVWYRVQIGPYHSLTKAKFAQTRLEHAKIDCILKRIG